MPNRLSVGRDAKRISLSTYFLTHVMGASRIQTRHHLSQYKGSPDVCFSHFSKPTKIVSKTRINVPLTNWKKYILNWINQTQSFELTGFQRDLLYVVAGSDQPSEQMVRREMEQYVDNVNHGRLYPNLDTLVEHSLVEKGSQDQRTNYYEVTERGKGLILDRHKWENQYVSNLLYSGQVNYASSSSD